MSYFKILLRNYSPNSWTYIDGHTSDEVNGKLAYMKLLSKSNGNFLVVPFSVNADDGYVNPVGCSGSFWSSSVLSGYVVYAWEGSYGLQYCGDSSSNRCVSKGVRGVVGQ